MPDPNKPQTKPQGSHDEPKKDKPAATARELSEQELKKVVGGALMSKKGASA